MTRRRKIILAGAGIGLLLLTLVIVLLPAWLPWVLVPIASRFGAGYGHYERLGYGRFALREVTYANKQVRFKAGRVETAIPTAVLWNRMRCNGSVLEIQNWSLVFVGENDTLKSSPTTTPADAVVQLQTTLDEFNDWIARAALTNGVATFQQQTAAVPWLVWQGTAIDARVVPTVAGIGPLPMELALRISETGAVTANVSALKLDFRSAIIVTCADGGVTVHATNSWNTNQFLLSARFTEGMIPESAQLSAPAVHVSDMNLSRTGYRAVDGSITAAWTNGIFEGRKRV